MALLHEDSHKNQGQGQQFGHMILTVNSGWLTLYKTCNQLIFEIMEIRSKGDSPSSFTLFSYIARIMLKSLYGLL